jgi:hypothetical protein
MKCHQQGHRNILVKFPSVATRAFAAFAFIPVGEHIKVMVADPTAYDVLVQKMVKTNWRQVAFTELSAFQIHDPFLDRSLLGPCQG